MDSERLSETSSFVARRMMGFLHTFLSSAYKPRRSTFRTLRNTVFSLCFHEI